MHKTGLRENQPSPKQGPVRCFHTIGGCRALDAPNQKLKLQPAASNGKFALLSVPNYHAGYATLQQAGLDVVGVDLYSAPEQADGRRPVEWRAHHPSGSAPTPWRSVDQADYWSFIAYAAFQQKQGALWDVASRVRHQLRTCEWRLRQVSEAYWQQLDALVRNQEFEVNRRFKDGFTWLGYLALQSFLVDACVLRDYLAEYRALILLPAKIGAEQRKIRLMSSLKKHYLDKLTSPDAIDQALIQATEPSGWLHSLSSYRDLVVHYAPLASAGKSLYALCIAQPVDAQTSLPAIKFPLPPGPALIKAGRSTGAYLDDPEMNYARLLNALEDPAGAVDGMKYAHLTLDQLVTLAADLSTLSPVKPAMPHLTQKDMSAFQVVSPRDESKPF